MDIILFRQLNFFLLIFFIEDQQKYINMIMYKISPKEKGNTEEIVLEIFEIN